MGNITFEITDLKCRICGKLCQTESELGSHVGGHRVKFAEYVAEHFLSNGWPTCPICGEKTRYQRGTNKHFKEYCKEHANVARSEWSQTNGFGMMVEAGWSKGLTKETHAGKARQAKALTGKNNPNAYSEEDYSDKLQIIADHGFNVLVSYENYRTSYYRLKTQCQKCSHVQKKHTLMNMLNQIREKAPIRCNKCNPFGQSIPETELYEYLKTVSRSTEQIERNYRGLGKELDVYLPRFKFAIEYNGLYWHSDKKKSAHYHKEKSE